MAGEREEPQKADPQSREYFIGMKAGIRRLDKLRGASEQVEPFPAKISVKPQQSEAQPDTIAPNESAQ